jgi:ABC-2 type transport system ATP-binding protein
VSAAGGAPGPTPGPGDRGTAARGAGGADPGRADGPAIAVEGLGRRFGDLEAVVDLELEVRRGELFGLVGPDGAGKTTTLRMLAGVLRPTAGDARLAGISVVERPEEVKRHIAYMPQRFGLYDDLTVLENLRFYADLFELPRADRERSIERLFEFSRLGPFGDRLAGNLSGGMRQKLGLSCALIHRPDVLLLDEPTFGVDPVSRRELWLIVHRMVAEGMTALVSTSYLDEAERFDRLALLHRGRRVALGTPAELRRPLAGRVLEVRTADPRRARRAARDVETGGALGIARAELFGERLHLTLDSPTSDPDAVAAALREAGAGEVEARRVEPSLEDVFVELAGGPEEAAGTAEAPAAEAW